VKHLAIVCHFSVDRLRVRTSPQPVAFSPVELPVDVSGNDRAVVEPDASTTNNTESSADLRR
jgi:hypothetical protein